MNKTKCFEIDENSFYRRRSCSRDRERERPPPPPPPDGDLEFPLLGFF
jgi:hypothetical protein